MLFFNTKCGIQYWTSLPWLMMTLLVFQSAARSESCLTSIHDCFNSRRNENSLLCARSLRTRKSKFCNPYPNLHFDLEKANFVQNSRYSSFSVTRAVMERRSWQPTCMYARQYRLIWIGSCKQQYKQDRRGLFFWGRYNTSNIKCDTKKLCMSKGMLNCANYRDLKFLKFWYWGFRFSGNLSWVPRLFIKYVINILKTKRIYVI
jgi:hypothetical protein